MQAKFLADPVIFYVCLQEQNPDIFFTVQKGLPCIVVEVKCTEKITACATYNT